MAEARRLKSGRWRIYSQPGVSTIRDPVNGTIPTFDNLAQARQWWQQVHPTEPPIQEAHKCARCGAYFGANTPWTVHAGRPYHLVHAPGYKAGRNTVS